MTAAWGFRWGERWGSGTVWKERETDRPGAALVEIPPGDLDAVTTAIERIWKQYEGTDTWANLALAIGQAFGDVEAVIPDSQRQRYVGSAGGVWLDQIGDAVSLPRAGWATDDDYRLAVIAEALSLVTAGTPDELIDLAQRLATDPDGVYYSEGVANFTITVPDEDGDRFTLMLDVMADTPPAGVGAWLETYPTAETAGWGWDDGLEPTPFGSWGNEGVDDDDCLSLWSYEAHIGD